MRPPPRPTVLTHDCGGKPSLEEVAAILKNGEPGEATDGNGLSAGPLLRLQNVLGMVRAPLPPAPSAGCPPRRRPLAAPAPLRRRPSPRTAAGSAQVDEAVFDQGAAEAWLPGFKALVCGELAAYEAEADGLRAELERDHERKEQLQAEVDELKGWEWSGAAEFDCSRRCACSNFDCTCLPHALGSAPARIFRCGHAWADACLETVAPVMQCRWCSPAFLETELDRPFVAEGELF